MGALEDLLRERWDARAFLWEDAWVDRMRDGLRPVGLAEHLDDARCARLEADLREAVGRPLAFRRRALPPEDGRAMSDLFYGPDTADVERAAELAERIEVPGREGYAADVEALGVLLGYPRCCTRAFGTLPGFLRRNLGWATHAVRCATPGPVDPRSNPFLGLKQYHLPCRADCPETAIQLDAAERALEARHRDDPAPLAVLREAIRLPVVHLLDAWPMPAVVQPSGEPRDDLLPCTLVEAFGSDARLAPLAAMDALRAGPEGVHVLLRGRELAFLPDAAVWWWQRAFHPEAWLDRCARRAAEAEAAADRPGAPPSPSAALAAIVASIVRAAGEALARRTPFSLAELGVEGDLVRVRLATPAGPVGVVVEPRDRAPRWFVAGRRCAISYDPGVPATDPLHHRAVRALATMVLRATDALEP